MVKARAALLAAAALLVGGRARAHDPFEITTDAHVSGDRGGLTLHTTMSLRTAGRACLDAAGAAVTAAELAVLKPRFEACARSFFELRAGDTELRPLTARVALTVEEDLEMWVTFPRPTRSPLVFEAAGLRRLPPRAGVVLTATGARTFLGQKVLRPDDRLFRVPITPQAEAPRSTPGGAGAASSSRSSPGRPRRAPRAGRRSPPAPARRRGGRRCPAGR